MRIKIAGAATFKKEFLIFFKINKFGKQLLNNYEISLYDGVNFCKWNGGRINRDLIFDQNDIEKFNKIGISIYFTFTNHYIDLNDKIGLKLLHDLDTIGKKYNIKNGIILINPDLNDFCKINYPELKRIYSITGHDCGANNFNINEYKLLEENYDLIVPKMEHIFNKKFYENINIEKYEILTNDTCQFNCPLWRDHFKAISDVNLLDNFNNQTHIIHNKVEECWLPHFDPDGESDKNLRISNYKAGMDLNKDMIKVAINIGYTNFKVSGRENSFEQLISDLKIFNKD